ncbi:hypothetical protein I317_06016 [Kwoniella heveanensis CBS 569]|nr:hypothetical protein I317_06016 [Kwoniella heveanensis CBS 569]
MPPSHSSGPFRSNRLRAPSLLPGARRPVIPVQQTLVVDVAHAHNHNTANTNEDGKNAPVNVKRRETIFGPDVGEDDEPGWNEPKREQVGVDKVKEWVEKTKSEEGLHATTTLQALVNLKRPTLLLQQLDMEESRPSTELPEEDIVSASATATPARNSYIPPPPLHILKFNYDATTPQVRISLEVYPTPQPPIEGKESIVEDHEPKLIYSGLHTGGFGQTFTLPHNAALDLSGAIVEREEDGVRTSSEEKASAAQNGTTVPTIAPSQVPEPVSTPTQDEREGGRRRLGGLFRRNRDRDEDLEAGMNGIELTNTNLNGGVNGENPEGENEEKKEKEIEQGMRLLIRIDGAGPEGQALARTNAQLTHILISGTWVADNNASTTNTSQTPGKRVWVIKVARREAIIGAHTFLLKEIYGLSSTSTSTSTTYPPNQDDPYASTPNECIVCLTSPRDVVLLPCRHLVVCRDCAVGMVEYGAGGKVARREEGANDAAAGENDAAGGSGAGGAGGSGSANTPQVAGGTTATGRERRKKKVKGWYCPVCRQPYTSLLRLALPESDKDATATGAGVGAELARIPSRAVSVRTTRSLRAPSLAPTLPEGAERMLDQLRPDDVRARDNDDDDDDDNEEAVARAHEASESERPQFVVANANDEDDKGETEHREHAGQHEQPQPHPQPQTQTTYDGGEKDTIDTTATTTTMAPFDLGAEIPSQATGGRASTEGKREENKGWKEVA